MTPLREINEFLGKKRLAVIGVSRNPKDFTRTLFRELLQRGYDAIPVNPAVEEAEGVTCYPRVEDISPAVEGALLLTSPAVTEKVVEECAHAGIDAVWLYRAGGAGAVSPRALEFCQSQGMHTVNGECPFMFLPGAAWPHRLHGFCRKVVGRYPK
ncbi:MAG: CoA-binding protein [Acidobacteriia bacterium]|nr:CoA-binding protein [Terriglobia bacterium]